MLGIFVVALISGLNRWGRESGELGNATADAWMSFAQSHNWPAEGGLHGVQFRGQIEGVAFKATATFRRVRRHRRHQTIGSTAEILVYAKSVFRVPIRGAVPVLSIRQKTLMNQLKLGVTGQRPFATDVMSLDSMLLISGEDVDEVVPLVRLPGIRKALELVFKMYPDAVIDDRAIELHLDFMPVSTPELEHIVQALTAVASAIETSIAKKSGVALPELPMDATPYDAGHAAPQPVPGGDVVMEASRPSMGSVTEQPKERSGPLPKRLRGSLKSLAAMSVKEQRMAIQHLRLPKYTFELEVRSIAEAVTRTGLSTGNYRVNGMLTGSRWRIELDVPADQANTVLTLMSGDVVKGECLLEDVLATRFSVEASTTQVVEVVSRGTPHADAIR